MNNHPNGRRRGDRPGIRGARGQALIEFAFSLLLFLLTMFGTIEVGIAVFRYNIVSDLAQEGVRRAAVCGRQRGLSATQCDIPAFVRSRSVGIATSVTTTPADLITAKAGDIVTVRVQHVFVPFTRLVRRSTITMSSTAQMVVNR